jgi:hypothetical protein
MMGASLTGVRGSGSLMPRSAILSPRQREEREVDEAETMRAHGQIAKSFAAKVLEVSTLISVFYTWAPQCVCSRWIPSRADIVHEVS